MAHTLPTLFRSASRLRIAHGFADATPTSLAPGFPFPACALLHVSPQFCISRYRNLNLLSIGYVFRPRLRPRLTQSRSALLWKPWIFGLRILTFLSLLIPAFSLPYSPQLLTVLLLPAAMLLYQCTIHSSASVVCFSPGHFRRRTSRLVSYYALFE